MNRRDLQLLPKAIEDYGRMTAYLEAILLCRLSHVFGKHMIA